MIHTPLTHVEVEPVAQPDHPNVLTTSNLNFVTFSLLMKIFTTMPIKGMLMGGDLCRLMVGLDHDVFNAGLMFAWTAF